MYLDYTYYINILEDAYVWLLESDCTQLCKYIHIVVKCGPRQYEKERCELKQVSMLPAIFLLSIIERCNINVKKRGIGLQDSNSHKHL